MRPPGELAALPGPPPPPPSGVSSPTRPSSTAENCGVAQPFAPDSGVL
eukprot:CAMPEP_0204048906 /NCGR_PEP_ID=MMETSP0360-20130528/117004_1 /ASSEMBLY_ACC=CAM_ASM_000342 /TAXON_ID=268821 /ORGANISM="Scrippsiella Hangoei, Strain SHTV-5" /LENGTH=47 /DNA_ID= /DNA_START= /DNA_END= /DNA_ORIENTATION=